MSVCGVCGLWLTDGDAVMVNMSSGASLPLYKFHSPVHCMSFSPDGRSMTAMCSLLSHTAASATHFLFLLISLSSPR